MRWLVLVALVTPVGCHFEEGVRHLDADIDSDGDGVLDGPDNCPQLANPDQLDWDKDGVGDACDGCPHLDNPNDGDADADGIGDECDPQPGVKDRRLYWLGFYAQSELAGWPNWMDLGQWTVIDHVLDQTNASAPLTLLEPPDKTGDIAFATEIEIAAPLVTGANEIGFCGGNITQGTQFYCCAVNGNGVRAASAWSVDPPGAPQDAKPFPGNLSQGASITVTGRMTATASECHFAQGLVTVDASTARGAPTPGTPVFYTSYAPGRWNYLFVVGLGP